MELSPSCRDKDFSPVPSQGLDKGRNDSLFRNSLVIMWCRREGLDKSDWIRFGHAKHARRADARDGISQHPTYYLRIRAANAYIYSFNQSLSIPVCPLNLPRNYP
jgi:hypothetical protein